MKSLCCSAELEIRDKLHPYSKRILPKGERELLLRCTKCGQKHQAREGAYSHPYIVKRKSEFETKEVSGTYRITKKREAKIVAVFGSVQKYLDGGKVV